jgi:hypothetical protein
MDGQSQEHSGKLSNFSPKRILMKTRFQSLHSIINHTINIKYLSFNSCLKKLLFESSKILHWPTSYGSIQLPFQISVSIDKFCIEIVHQYQLQGDMVSTEDYHNQSKDKAICQLRMV